METILESPTFTVAIADGFIQAGETTIIMQCHDRIFKNVEVRDESNEILFTVESKGISSMSWRRTVKDATGTPLFDLRKFFKYGVNRKWGVEDPSGLQLCSLRHVSTFRQFHALDVTVLNQADGGKEAVVNVRPKDQVGVTVQVKIRGAIVAEIQMTEANHSRTNFSEDRSVWRARIAGGVDLALKRIRATDFTPIKPYKTKVVLGVGQRADVLVEGKDCSDIRKGYWMRSDTPAGTCSHSNQSHALVAIYYDDPDTDSAPQSRKVHHNISSQGCIEDSLELTEPFFPEAPPAEITTFQDINIIFGANATGAMDWFANNISFTAS